MLLLWGMVSEYMEYMQGLLSESLADVVFDIYRVSIRWFTFHVYWILTAGLLYTLSELIIHVCLIEFVAVNV